jgi:hypothetical protein
VILDGYGADNAAAMVNDASGSVRVPGVSNNVKFKHYRERMFIIAKDPIKKGSELYVAYGFRYWKMTPDAYHSNNTDLNPLASSSLSPSSSLPSVSSSLPLT